MTEATHHFSVLHFWISWISISPATIDLNFRQAYHRFCQRATFPKHWEVIIISARHLTLWLIADFFHHLYNNQTVRIQRVNFSALNYVISLHIQLKAALLQSEGSGTTWECHWWRLFICQYDGKKWLKLRLGGGKGAIQGVYGRETKIFFFGEERSHSGDITFF